MQISFILFFLSALFMSSWGQTIKIAVYNSQQLNSVTFSIKEGRYQLKSDGSILGEYKKGAIFYVSRFGNSLEVRDKRNSIGTFDEIEFSTMTEDGIVVIKPVNPIMEGKEYDDSFIVRPKAGNLQILNKVDMEKYIASVIEAEGGNHAPAEYYKAQAVLIRTYTIKNMFKHAEEGYNLCDQVHCQAFKARSNQNPLILEAARSTAGVVLIDKDSVLVMSPFHSNCGGSTSAASMVWQSDLPYLRPISDPFCTQSRNAIWSTSIPRTQWVTLLKELNGGKAFYDQANLSFDLTQRTKSVQINGIEINLRQVREKYGLKSTLFSVIDNGSEIVFKGRGYGHGVGLCQEGAMEMARVGYTWLDIVNFYYQYIRLADYREMELHRY